MQLKQPLKLGYLEFQGGIVIFYYYSTSSMVIYFISRGNNDFG